MRAVVYHGPHDLRVEEVPDPAIEDPRDVIVRTRTASMCGSDLYLYQGEVEEMVAPGRTTLGHEISAEVVEVGPEVTGFAVGDRVTFPYSVSCGECPTCRLGQTAHCLTSGKAIYGYGGGLRGSRRLPGRVRAGAPRRRPPPASARLGRRRHGGVPVVQPPGGDDRGRGRRGHAG